MFEGGTNMLKKISFIVLSLILFISVALVPSNANATGAEQTLSEDDYGKYAIWFVANELSNEDNEWTEKTRISNVVPMKTLDNTIIGYTFELKTTGKDTGYIFVKYNEEYNEIVIAEYSPNAKPLYLEAKIKGNIRDVYSVGAGEYLVLSTNNKLYDIVGNEVDKNIIAQEKPTKKIKVNALNDSLKELHVSIDEWMLGYDGQLIGADGTNAGITDPLAYLKSRYGGTWTVKEEKILSVTAYLQNGFSSTDINNCVLSSVTTVLNYYRSNKGYSKIPSNVYTIYSDVKAIAIKYGYSPSGDGLWSGVWPTKINNIVTDAFAKYGYTVSGNSDYILSFGTFKQEIDNNRPVLFSNSNGYYNDHNFVVRGYRVYQSGSTTKNLLRVNDNWTTSERWYDYSAFNCCGSLTKMSK